MTRRKRPQAEAITGVTTQHGTITKVWSGDIVIDVVHRTRYRYSAFTRSFKLLETVDEANINRALRQAKTWLKPPPGSLPITGWNRRNGDAGIIDAAEAAPLSDQIPISLLKEIIAAQLNDEWQ